MLKSIYLIVVFYVLTSNVQCAWEHAPILPTNRRTQYYLQKNTGDYKYGFDTGNGFFATQSANNVNQVKGHFAYPIDGKIVDVKYTAGIQGYVPENLKNNIRGSHDLSYTAEDASGFVVSGVSLAAPSTLNMDSSNAKTAGSWSSHSSPAHINSSPAVSYSTKSNIGDNNDGSYSFSYETDHSSRDESADVNGNVRGYYSYQNDAGSHDLSYTAGDDSGFVVTGGSLATPSSFNMDSNAKSAGSWSSHSSPAHINVSPTVSHSTKSNIGDKNDGSYSFSYETDHSSRDESADVNGNVRGYYSYQNDAGSHDLSYTAGDDSGFVVTGGSLATPSSFNMDSNAKSAGSWSSHSSPAHINVSPAVSYSTKSNIADKNDGSYSFSYETDHSSRDESADVNGNVRGYYSYQNDAGSHDLSYTAGDDSGFVVTGGSLATPSSFNMDSNAKSAGSWSSHSSPAHINVSPAVSYSTKSNIVDNNDGSYSFSYETDHSSRDESADVNGNVRGYYSYQNDAGSHDLSYTAGDDSGFVVTGGSLATPSSFNMDSNAKSAGSWSSHSSPAHINVSPTVSHSTKSNIGDKNDGSYSFSYETDHSSRDESADVNGNVRGYYSYQNDAGSHDLSYTAGDDSGFVVTGGSLATPSSFNMDSNAKSAGSWSSHSSPAHINVSPAVSYSTKSNIADKNDGSYSFSYETDHSSRDESADVNGNVRGYYSYQNDAGSHDLSYTAGDDFGFVVTGGSLATPSSFNMDSNAKSVGSWSSHSSPAHINVSPAVSYSTKSNIGDKNDGLYSFSYETDHSSRDESADVNGNVRGYYSYQNDAESHDLSYTAGDDSGFVVTGGSLATPSSFNMDSNAKSAGSWSSHSSPAHINVSPAVSYSTKSNIADKNDGSYSFSYETDHSSRDESADVNGNVRGYYSYQNDAGSHDLSYTAGDDSGFVVTGGSLATPSSFNMDSNAKSVGSWSSHSSPAHINVSPAVSYSTKSSIGDNNDGSYSFSYETDHSSRDESADVNGNVRGYYSYQNDAGSHDLSYTAGDDSGFVVTGGSLAPLTHFQPKIESIIPFPENRRLFKPISLPESSESLPDANKKLDSVLLKAVPLAPIHVEKLDNSNNNPDKHRYGNIAVQKFLPGDNHYKTGYIFDSKKN